MLYGGNNNWFAAYAYWLLKLRGFDDVKLLNGGRKKWELESRELAQDVPSFPADRITIAGRRAARDPRAPRRGDRQGRSAPPDSSTSARPRSSAARSSRPTTSRRSSRRCRGTSPARRTSRGRRPRTTTARSSRADELKALYEAEGITADQEVIAYCRIGERSSHTWFALQELLGYPNVKNYDGSWTEYGSLVGAPVELG